jgi:hypothetical protein
MMPPLIDRVRVFVVLCSSNSLYPIFYFFWYVQYICFSNIKLLSSMKRCILYASCVFYFHHSIFYGSSFYCHVLDLEVEIRRIQNYYGGV